MKGHRIKTAIAWKQKLKFGEVIVIVITFYSLSCLGQETAQSQATTHGGGFTVHTVPLNAERQAGKL